MKVNFFIDSGANTQSAKDTGWLDTVEDLGLEEGEWEKMDREAKDKFCWDHMVPEVESWFKEEE